MLQSKGPHLINVGLYDDREKLPFLFNSKLFMKRNSSVLSEPNVIKVLLPCRVLPFSFFLIPSIPREMWVNVFIELPR